MHFCNNNEIEHPLIYLLVIYICSFVIFSVFLKNWCYMYSGYKLFIFYVTCKHLFNVCSFPLLSIFLMIRNFISTLWLILFVFYLKNSLCLPYVWKIFYIVTFKCYSCVVGTIFCNVLSGCMGSNEETGETLCYSSYPEAPRLTCFFFLLIIVSLCLSVAKVF